MTGADQKFSEDKDLRLAFRNAFVSPSGKRALMFMLWEMGFFSDSVESPEGQALRNYASKLVLRVAGNEDNMELAVQGMFREMARQVRDENRQD